MGYYLDVLDDVEHITEELLLRDHIYDQKGQWYMRIDKRCAGVALPQEIGQLIHGAIQAQVRSEKPGYEWVKSAIEKINCHKAVLYALNILRLTDRAKPTHGFRLFERYEYKYLARRDNQGVRDHLVAQLQ